MHFPFKPLIFTAILTAISAFTIVSTSCSSKADFKSLLQNVDTYHRDLLFERYEIAAKNITPESRGEWLDSIQAQHIRFAEIEVASTSPCAPDDIPKEDKYDPEKCAVIFSQMQWYVNGTPSVYQGKMRTVWQFDNEEKAWLIIEQAQH